MDNSTLTETNSQTNIIANEAVEALNQAIMLIGGVGVLFKSIHFLTQENDTLKASDLGSYICNDFINSLDCQREDLTNKLKILGGSHK